MCISRSVNATGDLPSSGPSVTVVGKPVDEVGHKTSEKDGETTVPVAAAKCELGAKMFQTLKQRRGTLFPLKMMQSLLLHPFFAKVLGSFGVWLTQQFVGTTE